VCGTCAEAEHAVCVELGLSFFGIHNTTSVCGEWSGRWGSNPRKQVFGSSVSKPLVTSMKRINGTIPVVCVIALAFFSCSVASAHAQNPQITPETNVDSSLLHTWLESGDPRLIAWAADFARRRHDADVVSEIPGVIGRLLTAPTTGEYQKSIASRRVVLALLDALIQEHATVSMELIQSLADKFPAQSMLLIGRVPLARSNSMLMNWAFSNDFGAAMVGTRSHAAAMILAHNPDRNFAYHIVEGLVQHVTVHVTRQRMVFAGAGGMSCGDSSVDSQLPGWPIVYDYSLLEIKDDAERRGSGLIPIVKLGDHTVEVERFQETGGSGGCWSGESDASFRHELVAYWVGVKPSEMPWQPNESFNVVWTTKSAYERELGSLIEANRVKMLGTLQQLQSHHLFDERMADGTFPQISISVDCQIHPCPLPDIQNLRQSTL